jgi:hypothetical protein
LTNGALHGTALTNFTGRATNLFVSELVVDGGTITNFSSPGAGVDSQRVGAGATAVGVSSVAIGVSAEANDDQAVSLGSFAISELHAVALGSSAQALGEDSVAIGIESAAFEIQSSAFGVSAVAFHSNSTAIGASSITTTNNQIMLGTASDHVAVAGELRGVVVTNALFTGTNRFNGGLYYGVTNVTGVANGDVLLNLHANRNFYELSGNSATLNICGIQNGSDGRSITLLKTNVHTVVIRNLSGAAGTAASERVYTGTGADVTLTNTPCLIRFVYRGGGFDAWVLDNLK